MLFDEEKEKFKRLEMAEKLQKKIQKNRVELTGAVFDSLVFVYTESQ